MTKSLRIAIADDEAEIRRFFEEIVRRLGHEVTASVGNGCELVEQCRSQPPDLIITDVLMPGMNGIDAARKIGNEHPVSVIVVSSLDATELENRGGCEHVGAFLTKPIKASELQTAISHSAQVC
jgi:CheY-like chemotaxis protein